MVLSIKTLSLITLCHYAECHCTEVLHYIFMLIVVNVNVVRLSVVAPWMKLGSIALTKFLVSSIPPTSILKNFFQKIMNCLHVSPISHLTTALKNYPVGYLTHLATPPWVTRTLCYNHSSPILTPWSNRSRPLSWLPPPQYFRIQ